MSFLFKAFINLFLGIMPGPPPPPPPGGPPPLAMPSAFPLSGGKNSQDNRGALLQSIRKGTKLKKTVTVDKSAPLIAGESMQIYNDINILTSK